MQKVIDIHAHLGDIFASQRNVIYKQNVPRPSMDNPFIRYAQNGFTGPLIDPSKPEELKNIHRVGAEECWANTLQRVSEILDVNSIDYVCMLPIWPQIGFEDYLAASKLEPRILPFTSADWSLGNGVGKKLLQDAAKGARGWKIHPVLQPINLNDPLVDEALRHWEETGLPVVSHCGANGYYDGDDCRFEVPENGNLSDFIKMVKRFPRVNFIAGHCGGLTGGEMEELAKEMAGSPNLWVDTTFRSVEDVRQMVSFFGEEHVLFGTDCPFAPAECSLQVIRDAFGEGSALANKVLYENAVKLLRLNEH